MRDGQAIDLRYPIPGGSARAELKIQGSRFLAEAAYTPEVAAARAQLAAVRAAMPDASHHCYAYLVGYGASVTAGMGDDGEPSGTAGRPMLAVLRGADLGDITVVVTRYFGGTLLGTGGLVRAYSDAVRAVLEVLPRAERVLMRTIQVLVSYADYALARRTLEAHGATLEDEQFGVDVQLLARLPAAAYAQAVSALDEVTAGNAIVG